jgi:hypothetical protein
VLLVALLATACDDYPHLDRIAIGNTREGYEVLHVLCPDEAVTSVALYAPTGRVIGPEDGELLWEIRNTGGSRLERYVVGEAPDGFDVAEPLTRSLEHEERLGVEVAKNRGWPAVVGWDPAELDVGEYIDNRNDPVNREQFLQEAGEACAVASP